MSIQSMTNTDTRDYLATIRQILELEEAGCDIVRIAVPNIESVYSIKKIKEKITIPLVADIHFDYKLALASIEAGVDGIRINPGNIGSEDKVYKVVQKLKDRDVPVRIGVNSGSLPEKIQRKYGITPEGIVESALTHIAVLEKFSYENIKVSVKTSSVPLTIESYRLLSSKVDYPLHLGVTEAGTFLRGSIKSSVAIGTLLYEGIGDTIRVSLTENPLTEVFVAKEILKSLGLKKGYDIISCPTCGRTKINIMDITRKFENEIRIDCELLKKLEELNLKIAIMGCIVNGPGEAKEADIGIAGGDCVGIIFKKGKIIKKVPEDKLIPELVKNIKFL